MKLIARGRYEIIKSNKILEGHISKGGYLSYTLTINGKVYTRLAHLLVAKQFIPNPNNLPIVNHKDENKLNPCVDNLEWTTYAKNLTYGTAQNRSSAKRNIPINEYGLDGTYIRTWKSAEKIYEYLGLPCNREKRTTYLVKILTHNDQPDSEKIVFAGKVFLRYHGYTSDMDFCLKAPTNFRNNIYRDLSISSNVPDDYLVNLSENHEDFSAILEDLLESNYTTFSTKQILALKYAIKIIKESEEI